MAMSPVDEPAVPHSRPWITAAEHQAIADCLTGGMIARGAAVERFERAIASRSGFPSAVATGNGTNALIAALHALSLPTGGEVILPSYVCGSVAQAVRVAGLVPRWCDIGDDWEQNADTVRQACTARSVAVIVVHLFGRVMDTAAIAAIGLPVIDDLCQAFGASASGRSAAAGAEIAITSFHATKCLSTGEGGAVLIRDAATASRVRETMWGATTTSQHSALSDLQAVLGLAQLARYDAMLARRAELSARYDAVLRTLPRAPRPSPRRADHTPLYRYTVRGGDDFPVLAERFAAHGVQVRRGVDVLLHQGDGSLRALPSSDTQWRDTVSLPVHPSLTDREIWRVEQAIRAVWGVRE